MSDDPGTADICASAATASSQSEEWLNGIDWNEVGEAGVDLLRQYLRIQTVNDPAALPAASRDVEPWRAGHEAEAAEWLARQLRAEQIEVQLLESAPGRVNVVARLRGRRGAMTLLTHSDVVPALRRDWSRGIDPFGGEVHDGYIYGRGALDLKGLGIMHLMSLVLLKRCGVPLERDVVLLIVADEETGGEFGARWLLARHPELFDTDVVLGEGAYSIHSIGSKGVTVQAIAVGEKGYLELELLTEGPTGHASMPAANNAPLHLVRALNRILNMRRPIHVTPLTKAFLKKLAQTAHGIHRVLFSWPELVALLRPHVITESALFSAMLQDTLVATVLEAGHEHNVVPAQARAILSIRLLPETDPREFREAIGRAVGDSGIAIREVMHKPANMSRFDTPIYRCLEQHALWQNPGAIVMPILSPGASDCRFWRARGIASYGWIPCAIPAADLRGVHGVDERVSIVAFTNGLKSLYGVVLALATMTQPGQLRRCAGRAAVQNLAPASALSGG